MRYTQAQPKKERSGEDHNQRLVRENTILAAVVGSKLSGLETVTSDRDEMAVAVEPPESVFAVAQGKFEHLVDRVRAHGEVSQPGDVERTTYSLRKYLSLAAKGNPHVLSLLWVPEELKLVTTPTGAVLEEIRDEFRTVAAVRSFCAYAIAQSKRLRGELGNNVKRPELEAAYGYDTKYAAHILRLGYQGRVFAEDGYIPQPLPEPVRSEIMSVRMGEVVLEDALSLIDKAISGLRAVEEAAERALPQRVDSEKLTKINFELHQQWWSLKGYTS